jgi:hypothetical protein
MSASEAMNDRLKITSKLISDVHALAKLDIEEGCYLPEELKLVVGRADRPKVVRQMKADNPKLTTRQIAKAVGATHTTVRRDLGHGTKPGINIPKTGTDIPTNNPIPDINGASKKYLSRLLDFKASYLNGLRNWLVGADPDENTREVLARALHSFANECATVAQEMMEGNSDD